MKKETLEKLESVLEEIMKLSYEKAKDGDITDAKINQLSHDGKKYLLTLKNTEI